MAVNIEMNYFNGSSYEVLYPSVNNDIVPKKQLLSYTGTGEERTSFDLIYGKPHFIIGRPTTQWGFSFGMFGNYSETLMVDINANYYDKIHKMYFGIFTAFANSTSIRFEKQQGASGLLEGYNYRWRIQWTDSYVYGYKDEDILKFYNYTNYNYNFLLLF